MSDKKNIFLGTVRDLVSNLFYYDRKGDEDLSLKDVEKLIASGTLSLDEIIETFRDEIKKNYPELK